MRAHAELTSLHMMRQHSTNKTPVNENLFSEN